MCGLSVSHYKIRAIWDSGFSVSNLPILFHGKEETDGPWEEKRTVQFVTPGHLSNLRTCLGRSCWAPL
jgi:hypothetical protein